MIGRDKIQDAVFRAIEQARELSLDVSGLVAEESRVLVGEGGELDSMGFVNLIVALEEEINHLTGRPLDVLSKINAATADSQPVSTVGQLIDVLCNAVQP